jgi:hypothetical protein
MANVGRNMLCDVEEILTFKICKGLKKHAACETSP